MKIEKNLTAAIVFVFGMICFSGCNSEEMGVSDENIENDQNIEIYEQAKANAEKQNADFMKKIANTGSRSEDGGNLKLVNYLMTLPSADIDSLYNLYLPFVDQIDSLQDIGTDKFIETYGLDEYRKYIDFFGDGYVPGAVQLVISKVRGMESNLSALYLKTAGRIDGGFDNPLMSRSFMFNKDQFDYCIGQLAYSYGEGVARNVAFVASSEISLYFGQLELSAVLDLVDEGIDFYDAVNAVKDFNRCMR